MRASEKVQVAGHFIRFSEDDEDKSLLLVAAPLRRTRTDTDAVVRGDDDGRPADTATIALVCVCVCVCILPPFVCNVPGAAHSVDGRPIRPISFLPLFVKRFLSRSFCSSFVLRFFPAGMEDERFFIFFLGAKGGGDRCTQVWCFGARRE